MVILIISQRRHFFEALTRGADARALANAGERAEVREDEPCRGRGGAHGGSEGRGGSHIAAARNARFSLGAGGRFKDCDH